VGLRNTEEVFRWEGAIGGRQPPFGHIRPLIFFQSFDGGGQGIGDDGLGLLAVEKIVFLFIGFMKRFDNGFDADLKVAAGAGMFFWRGITRGGEKLKGITYS
jgi:hypothetical protein